MSRITPTGREVFFEEDELIVSKTDLSGKITYANDTFLRVAGFTEAEVLNMPHSIIRHPDMPRAVFKLLWDTISRGEEIFAYVVNLTKSGDHYWVFAHVTPTFNSAGTIVGYHSNRRVPDRTNVDRIKGIYALLLAEERKHSSKVAAVEASTALLQSTLSQSKTSYDQFVFQNLN